MRFCEFVTENTASDTGSNDYQQMQDFVRANQVPGVPPDQQIALALFKELQKQKQQNSQLSAELSNAEQRIDQATQSNDLQSQELGMHAAELEREQQASEKQQASIGQLGQQYTERERASKEQVQSLAAQLETVKTMPGVSKAAAADLEQQIKELSKNGVSAQKYQELENSIAAIQNAESADDAAIKDLTAQVKAAQAKATELSNTKASLSQDVKKVVDDLRSELSDLETSYQETDATVYDLENELHRLQTTLSAKSAAIQGTRMITPKAPVAPAVPAQPARTQPQWTPAARATAQKLINKGILQPEPVAESAFKRSIAWATGKTK